MLGALVSMLPKTGVSIAWVVNRHYAKVSGLLQDTLSCCALIHCAFPHSARLRWAHSQYLMIITASLIAAAPGGDLPRSILSRCNAATEEPATEEAGVEEVTGEVFSHGQWPFTPAERPEIPIVGRSDWLQNPIDAFVLAKLEEKAISPNEKADKLTLLRRLTFDLTGLPPTVDEQREYLSDTSPEAYSKVVDRLLASPHYGERWAQHWLDVVRYAETEGFKSDQLRPNAYRYRDYVIRALNNDLPYDRFVRQQIAGDELEPHNPSALIATGVNHLYPDEDNAANLFSVDKRYWMKSPKPMG